VTAEDPAAEAAPGASAAPAAAEVGTRNRNATVMAVFTAVSRASGFARIVVVAAVLGTSYLGNTYQSANTIPNILFELFAAGVLQSVLIPIMVDAVDGHSHREAEETAGVVLGAMLTLLAAVVAAGLVAGTWIMELLVSGVDDAAIRAAEVQLGTFLLWFFLPQILFYAASMVAAAVLNATGHFWQPVFAPTVNNVVVIGTYLLFAAMRDGQAPSLDLTTPEQLVLAVGTLLGVVAFCAVPVVAAWRTGFRLRPSFRFRHPVLRRLARQGAWAAGFLGASQALLVAVLYLANGSEGGVVVYQLAYVLFMLPVSLFAVPVFTTAFPDLTRFARKERWSDFGDEVGRTVRSVSLFTIASAGALAALSGPIAHVVALGNASDRVLEVSGAVAGFAIGVPGFALVLLLTRVSYSYQDTRTPTLVNVGVAVLGTLVMAVLVSVVPDVDRITALGVGYGSAQLVGAAVLAIAIRARVHRAGSRIPTVGVPVIRDLVATGVASAVVFALVRALPDPEVATAIALCVAGGAVLAGLLLVLLRLLGGPSPARTLRSLGGDPGRVPSGAG
jgi:putative peptidoglycan lipid II flippase